jgi:hypothetical protein
LVVVAEEEEEEEEEGEELLRAGTFMPNKGLNLKHTGHLRHRQRQQWWSI